MYLLGCSAAWLHLRVRSEYAVHCSDVSSPSMQLSLELSLAHTGQPFARDNHSASLLSAWMAGKLLGSALGHVCSPAIVTRAILGPACARRPAATVLTTRSLHSSRHSSLHLTAPRGPYYGCCSLAVCLTSLCCAVCHFAVSG